MSYRVPLFIRRGGLVLYKGKTVTVLDYYVDYKGVGEVFPERGKLILVLDTKYTVQNIEYSYTDIKPVD